jgi:hypothetical protein
VNISETDDAVLTTQVFVGSINNIVEMIASIKNNSILNETAMLFIF